MIDIVKMDAYFDSLPLGVLIPIYAILGAILLYLFLKLVKNFSESELSGMALAGIVAIVTIIAFVLITIYGVVMVNH